jgi:hypothetical protein
MIKSKLVSLCLLALIALSQAASGLDQFEVYYKKDVRSLSESNVRGIVETALKDVLDADPYYKAMSHVYSDENGEPRFLVTYLLRSDCLLYESYKINLDENAEVLTVQREFENPDAEEEAGKCYSCPDPEVEVYVESAMDGAPLGAAEWCYSVALGAGYKTAKDIQANATAERFKQYLTCPKIKCVIHVGHGNNEKGILFAQTDIQYPWFAALPNDYLAQQIHMYGSCLVHNDPFKAAILGTGVESFMGGVTTIDITTLQNTMFAISQGIFYGQEVKAAFNNSDAKSKGWGISGNPPNGPWYVDFATPIGITVPQPDVKTPDLLCRYSKTNQNIAVTYVVKHNPDAASQKVTLDIYSLEGRLIKNLVNEQKQNGTYTVKWNIAGQVNGVYIVKLTIGNKKLSASTVVYR